MSCVQCACQGFFSTVFHTGFIRVSEGASPKISVSYNMLPPKLSPITQSPKHAGIWNPDYNPHFKRVFYSNQGSTVISKPTETESFRNRARSKVSGLG